MKKIFVFLMLMTIIFITGCGKDNVESVFKDFFDLHDEKFDVE